VAFGPVSSIGAHATGQNERVTDPRLLATLRDAIGPSHVITDPDRTAAAARDWTGRFVGHTDAVVRPGTTEEVAAVVRACGESGVAIVPQGGNTGLVGGGVPLAGELVLSLTRLIGLGPIDTSALQVTVGAGATLADVQRLAAGHDLAYGVDLAARETATIGGTIATIAGGVHVLRFGATRQQVLGVTAVLGDGSIVSHLAGLVKDNTGYDLAGLLCGSEGTLGIVTEARLRLVPRYEEVVVALVALDDVATAVDLVAQVRRSLASLSAAELFFDPGMQLVCASQQLAPPFPAAHPVYVLLEAMDHRDPTDALAVTLQQLAGVRDVAVARDRARREQLWSYRELHTLAINTLGPPHKLDVTLPHGSLARFVGEASTAVMAVEPAATVWMFGHVGDGNVHVNVTGVGPDNPAVDDVVLDLVAHHGGSISAEHGIGTAKKPWLHLNRSPSEIAAFRHIKNALDPHGILNPGALLP
jgi:FAD/FMN-containing dehydrogenase